MTGEYVFSYSMSSLYKKPCATNRVLYLMISLFSFRFRRNTLLYPTGFTSSSVWTTSPKTFCFVNEFNFAYIAFFHFGQSFLCRHSYTFRGSGSSSFLMISKTTWKAKILLITILFQFHFSPMYITYCDLKIFRYMCLFEGFSFNMCLFKGFLHYLCLF